MDNNPGSPFYGRMYISYNNFNIGGGALYVVYSDDGTTWTQVPLNPGFIRNIQVTGDLQGSGRVYVAAMNEGTGGLSTRQNVMYRSTDGGVSWTSTNAGPSFQAPGRATCTQQTYFTCMFNNGITIWRHMGWGQPAASGNVVGLTYAACGNPAGGACSGADRSRQRLLHPLDRRRTKLGHAGQAEHRYRDGHAVAALAGCDTDRHAIRRLV